MRSVRSASAFAPPRSLVPRHTCPQHTWAELSSPRARPVHGPWCVHPSRPLRPQGAGGTVSKPWPYSAIVLVGVSMSPPWREGRRSSVAGVGRGFVSGLRPPLRPLLRRPSLPCRRLLILQTPAGARLLPSGPLPQPPCLPSPAPSEVTPPASGSARRCLVCNSGASGGDFCVAPMTRPESCALCACGTPRPIPTTASACCVPDRRGTRNSNQAARVTWLLTADDVSQILIKKAKVT